MAADDDLPKTGYAPDRDGDVRAESRVAERQSGARPLSLRIELVRAAIERVEASRAAWREAEADASSRSIERMNARAWMMACEREFGWQSENVKAILEAFGEVPKSSQSEAVPGDRAKTNNQRL